MTEPSSQPVSGDVAHRLRTVSRRIESFFERQVERLEHAISQLQDSGGEYEMARRLSIDLDEQRAAWEIEREEEMIRLAEASQSLARSWHELEQRQRELETSLLKSQSPTLASPRRAMAAAHVGASSTSPVGSPGEGMELFEMRQLQANVNRHTRRGR